MCSSRLHCKIRLRERFLLFLFPFIASKIKYCPSSSAINCRWIGIHQNLPKRLIQLILSSDNYMKPHTICLWERERESTICMVKWITSFVTYSAGQVSKTSVINGYFQAILHNFNFHAAKELKGFSRSKQCSPKSTIFNGIFHAHEI